MKGSQFIVIKMNTKKNMLETAIVYCKENAVDLTLSLEDGITIYIPFSNKGEYDDTFIDNGVLHYWNHRHNHWNKILVKTIFRIDTNLI